MKMLLGLLIVPLMLTPTLVQGAEKPVFSPGIELTRTLNAVGRLQEPTGLLALSGARPKTPGLARVSKGARVHQAIASARALPATEELPSFAIKGGGDSRQASNGSSPGTSTAAGTDGAASPPPVSFSFAASGQSYSSHNRYRGGVYMAAPF